MKGSSEYISKKDFEKIFKDQSQSVYRAQLQNGFGLHEFLQKALVVAFLSTNLQKVRELIPENIGLEKVQMALVAALAF